MNIKAVFAAIGIALAMLSHSAAAGPVEDCQAAYGRSNFAETLKLCRPLAEQGHVWAQRSLGAMYEHGLGVPQDYSEAVKWYRNAAEQGYAHAQFHLGNMYENGLGVPQDYVAAHMWFNLAAAQAQGWNWARDDISKKMTPEEIAEAQRLAREWLAAHKPE